MSNHTNCPKCAGTGVVSAFLHIKDGECFDCNGTGRLDAAVAKVAGKPSSLNRARVIADAFMADPSSVGTDLARSAFETYEATFRGQWSQNDYPRRNALAAFLDGARA